MGTRPGSGARRFAPFRSFPSGKPRQPPNADASRRLQHARPALGFTPASWPTCPGRRSPKAEPGREDESEPRRAQTNGQAGRRLSGCARVPVPARQESRSPSRSGIPLPRAAGSPVTSAVTSAAGGRGGPTWALTSRRRTAGGPAAGEERRGGVGAGPVGAPAGMAGNLERTQGLRHGLGPACPAGLVPRASPGSGPSRGVQAREALTAPWGRLLAQGWPRRGAR